MFQKRLCRQEQITQVFTKKMCIKVPTYTFHLQAAKSTFCRAHNEVNRDRDQYVKIAFAKSWPNHTGLGSGRIYGVSLVEPRPGDLFCQPMIHVGVS